MILVIHLSETDGDIIIQRFGTMEEATSYIKKERLVKGDYNIIDGHVIE